MGNLENPRWIRIHLRHSKTDPFREGAFIFLPRTKDDLCPVAALLAWLTVRGISPSPLFSFASGASLTRAALVKHVIQASGLDPRDFSGHSFRSGEATTASLQGISDANLKLLGRWKSNAYQRYIKPPGPELATLAGSLSQNRSPCTIGSSTQRNSLISLEKPQRSPPKQLSQYHTLVLDSLLAKWIVVKTQ